MTNNLPPITSFERGVRRFATALTALLCSGAGCAGDMYNQPFVGSSTETTELLSNLPETRFYTRLRKVDADPEEGWRLEGQGKRVAAELRERGRYEIRATHEGYRDKFGTLTEPIPRVTFDFLDADRIEHVEWVRPPIPPEPPRHHPPERIANRWAVVIGVSEYKDHRIPRLRYAARDARVFHEWLTSANGGGYAPTSARLLTNERATLDNIKDALLEWLAGKALGEDLVVIYFSGHGTPESPDRPENLYLVPYDADFARMASTAYPMWHIEDALRRHIRARKVVVFADACHAGAVGAEFLSARRAIGRSQAALVTHGLQDLSKVGDGVAVFTSADTNELSQENEKWGGGHGVFTYYLLEGLGGKADSADDDSRVSLGELSHYVTDRVGRATGGAQRPRVAGNFDPTLTLGR